jgi:uncharacterized protein YjaZ
MLLISSLFLLFGCQDNKSIDYSGYADVDLLKQGLLDHLGDGDVKQYKSISKDQKNDIETIITETIEKCNGKISVPTKNFIFIHPFIPDEDDKIFDGVTAVAVYSCVFHLYINLDQYTKKSLENTVSHELNHTIYYYNHYDNFNKYTLLDEILLEGLAENFREQYFDKNITPWAGAFEKDDALQVVKNSVNLLDSVDSDLISKFLFGGDNLIRWAGYSMGYWLVKEFIKKNPDISWNDLMKLKPNDFLVVLK